MGKTIVIANQKGGVGKTTTSINLASSLASFGHKTLVIDMDPQGNASSGLGINKNAVENTIYDVLVDDVPVENACIQTAIANLMLLPSNTDLVGAEIELVTMPEREFRLRQRLESLKSHFEYLLIDCPPSLGLLTLNSLVAADSVLVPLQCEYYALEGLTSLLETLIVVHDNLNPQLKVEGILLTMFQHTNLSKDVMKDVQSQFAVEPESVQEPSGDSVEAPLPETESPPPDAFISRVRNYLGPRVFNTVIPRNVALSEAPSHGKPILQYDPKSVGARAYLALAEEVLKRG